LIMQKDFCGAWVELEMVKCVLNLLTASINIYGAQ
jgi:hypothetical protein